MTFPVIGVVGGGQLARMMVPVAVELGFELRILAEGDDVSAVSAARYAPVGDYRDLETLRDFAQGVDVLTFDHEHVPTEHLRTLISEGVNVQPGPEALQHAQDKLVMRAAVERLGLPNPAWAAVSSPAELIAFADKHGWPVVLKTPRGGYDGKGVRVVQNPEQAIESADWFAAMTPLLVEQKVDFSRELSALVARRPSGEARAWSVVQSNQLDGVCDEVIAPAPELDERVAVAAQNAALEIAEELGVTGVMAVELFETPGLGPGFLINELAMRPHNSGHWSMDGALTGQFEQHLRAVLDLPLGDPQLLCRTVMKNILGGSNHDLAAALPTALSSEPAVKFHGYGKSVRPGRKVAHVNALAKQGESLDAQRQRAERAARIIRDGSTAVNPTPR
ncbi:5-(carboxyamino)imidazole ribonucleotide synthase [Psychromicrobium lacuslunae]|uniref:N5-carboxyaminoimidazole ribonucleotide synthase n=1 Tax=Psychromicrobium lacuslunae TaxID=1618207 RepID=A0A0D4BVR6_9MICC|nr:5-(carboxyamino)imidazole ribonucleotide synthase [Psychromicrobium lacuslunae]AJT40419.1 phosphoribosylaminoimidazole carboxylase [Psychromicrobium lacuslunae]